ncbi:MAG: YdeI/OmpD-associated family protein [Saprospiraceae bacterium]|nr:YdeI/OmpD-associated family protein [Saprospiraceae bacterium]
MTIDKNLKPTFFTSPEEFRSWLEKHHKTESELIVVFYKVATGKATMTWSESVDQALCFGWIDGITRSIDKESYCIRFTPRKPTSIWSTVNIKKMEKLTRDGLMTPAGEKAFSLRKEDKSNIYSHEKEPVPLDPHYVNQFQNNKTAWEFFIQQAPSYQKVMIHWIMSAKQEKTRQNRLDKMIKMSEMRKRVT